jgi:hypothetical protein
MMVFEDNEGLALGVIRKKRTNLKSYSMTLGEFNLFFDFKLEKDYSFDV